MTAGCAVWAPIAASRRPCTIGRPLSVDGRRLCRQSQGFLEAELFLQFFVIAERVPLRWRGGETSRFVVFVSLLFHCVVEREGYLGVESAPTFRIHRRSALELVAFLFIFTDGVF